MYLAKKELGRDNILIIIADSSIRFNLPVILLKKRSCTVPNKSPETETHTINTAIAISADILFMDMISENRTLLIQGISIPVIAAINANPKYPATPGLSIFPRMYP